MSDRGQQREELLLDLYLGQLDAETQAWLEAELRLDAELRVKYERLTQVLAPLDSWEVAPPPADLTQSVLRHVKQRTLPTVAASDSEKLTSTTTIPFPTQVTERATGGGRGWYFAWRDIAAIAACILLLFTVMVPGLSRMRSRAQQMSCAENLSAIHQGTAAYNASFGGLPFAGSDPGRSWLPDQASSQPHQSNSRHPYILIRLNQVSPAKFVCPADRQAQPMDLASTPDYDDFPTRRNLSFDTLNMTGPMPSYRTSPDLAYMSDHNPLFVRGEFDESLDPDEANSPTHRSGAGQNVLFLDGRVEWLTSPVYGPRRDNVWLIGQVRHYTGSETRLEPDDAFLVPGFPLTDPALGTEYAPEAAPTTPPRTSQSAIQRED